MTMISRSSEKRSHDSRSTFELQPKEYFVTLVTTEVDEYGAPWEHKVNVVWDAGIIPDWDYWLLLYNQDEKEVYRIDKIIPVDPEAPFEM
jgi:hypothetical protein